LSDVFQLAGVTVAATANDALPIRCRESFGQGPASFHVQRRAIHPEPEASDPWMGKTWTWSNSGNLYFSGAFRSRTLRRGDVGWILDYQAIGLSDLLDKFPITDATTSLDVSPFNCSPEDLINYRPASAGRTIGQIITIVLTSLTNGANLTAYGLGGLTGPTGGVYVLPSATIADLAALSIIPPKPIYVSGEKFGGALVGFLSAVAPNVRMWVQPNGILRFLDLTTFGPSVVTLTMGSDPIEPTEISRDVSDCWQRIEIRGAPIAIMGVFKLSNGTLLEKFAWGTYTTNAAAIAAWLPANFTGTASTQDQGTCTDSSTTTVVVTSSNASATWPSDYWDQTSTGVKGIANFYDTVNPGVTSIWTSPIVANTALTAGGTSTLTLAAPLPVLTYNTYTLSGLTAGASQVWRHYQIADSTLWALVVQQSTYPQAWVNGGGGAVMISSAMGAVFYPSSGPPYNMFPLPFQVDDSGNIIFVAPTYVTANNSVPADVWCAIPINTGPNVVYSPVNTGGPPATTPAYAGDSHTIEGLADTLVVTIADWRDPGQTAQVQALANDWLKSVQDGVREGDVVYHGLYPAALTFGICLNIAGKTDSGGVDTTGWEAAELPVIGFEVEFSQGADDYVTTLNCSSRRGHLSAEIFLKPERSMTAFGLASGSDATSFVGTFGLGDVRAQASNGSTAFGEAQQAGAGGIADASSSGMQSIAAGGQGAQAGIVGSMANQMGSTSLPADLGDDQGGEPQGGQQDQVDRDKGGG
jgi:hypothetical protein